MLRRVVTRGWLLAGLIGAACSEPEVPTGEGLFLHGCPVPGQAFVRQLADAAERPSGPHAIALPGDTLIANEKAAFVITQPGEPRTYYYYGGILVDAVAVSGCAQAAPERFGELAPLAGRLDITNFPASVLRGFHADRIETLNDGQDGKAAVVRVHGTDDRFWLVEMELQRRSWDGGTRKPPTGPMGLEWVVDYVLEPGSAVLKIVPRFKNTRSEAQALMSGAAIFTGDTTPMPETPFYADRIRVGGFSIGFGAPWLAAGENDGSYAFSIDTNQLGSTNIAGVNALVDVAQALERPLKLEPAGQEGDEASMTLYLSVGATDLNSAITPLAALAPGGRDNVPLRLAGRVHEPDGTPVPGARIDVQREGEDGEWETIDELRCAKDGTFAGSIPDFGDGKPWHLIARDTGRTPTEPIEVTLPTDVSNLDFTMLQAGGLGYVVSDEAGGPLPAKITLVQEVRGRQKEVRRLFTVDGRGEAKVEPGKYKAFVTRGPEYEVHTLEIEVKPAQSAPVEVTLKRLVDTRGWISMDGHVHQAPSEDSVVTVAHRFDTFAAEGSEVMVATDHEIIADIAASDDAKRLAKFVKVFNGQEVTAVSPEHTNMWGVEVDPTKPRGGPVRWYGQGLDEIFDAERARGAHVVTLNHPREDSACSWLCEIDWDRLTGLPRATDPSTWGLNDNAQLWAWNFDAVELMNGTKDIFMRKDPRRSGKFDDWMAFHNLGHKITGVAVTDTHDDYDVGSPRNYLQVSSDDPADFTIEALEAAVKRGRVSLSAGAFARVTIDGRGLGDTVTAANGRVEVSIHVEAVPQVDVKEIKVFANCDEVLSLEAANRDGVVKLDTTRTLELPADAHVVVVGWGEKPLPHGFIPIKRATPRFLTNPIFVDVDGGGFTAPGGKTCTYTAPL